MTLQVDFNSDERPTKSTNLLLAEFADVLRANPGRWGKWPKHLSPVSVSSVAARINHQTGPIALRGPFEARTSRGVLYVRYQPVSCVRPNSDADEARRCTKGGRLKCPSR